MSSGAYLDGSSHISRPPWPDRGPIFLTKDSGYGTRDETLKATQGAVYGAS